MTPEAKGALLVALMKALDSDDREFVKAVVWLAHNTIVGRDNTNLILYGLATTLVEDLKKSNITTPSFYPGVFPTDSYNAQCTVFDGQNLLLLDTGCMEMAEAIVVSFLSKATTQVKVSEISTTIDNYVLQGQRPDSGKANTQGIKFGSGLPSALVTSFEEYMVAHELGHLALGHATDYRTRKQSSRIGKTFDVVAKDEFQELQADMWACRALIQCAHARHRSDSDVPLAVGGVSLGLGVGLLVEASAEKHGIRLPAGHPPALERLYMVQVGYELFGAHQDAYVARRFNELLEEVVPVAYPSAELPPLLARDLNQKLVPVLDSLQIDYSNAPYITEFLTGEMRKPAETPPAEPQHAAAAAATFKAKLSIIRGGRKGQEFELEVENNQIGRWDPETGAFPEVDLDQDDPEAKVSRKHALVRIDGGKITVEDIGSLNGTYVNRQPRLIPGTPVELKNGDEIIIGKTFLRLVIEPIS